MKDAKDNAELVLAELHAVLSLKQEHPELTLDDRMWLDDTAEFYERRHKELDIAKLTINLTIGRLLSQPYVSTVVNLPVDITLARRCRDKVKKQDTEQEKERKARMIYNFQKGATNGNGTAAKTENGN